MRNQIALVVLGSLLGVIGTGAYDNYVRPKLFYTIDDMVTYGNGYESHRYSVKVTNSGWKPAEDVTCRISVDGEIKYATSVVNGETKTIAPDHPNALLDKIAYLNHGRSATFEIEARGRAKKEVFVLVLAKGVQAEKQQSVQDQTSELLKAIAIVVIGLMIAALILPRREVPAA